MICLIRFHSTCFYSSTLRFISTNQWHHQVISINLYELKLKLQVQNEISVESAN